MRWRKFLLVNASYLLVMLAATFYWAANGYDYVHVKGDAEMYFILFAVGLAQAAVLINSLLIRNVGFPGVLSIPVLSCILAIIASFGLLLLGMGGTPSQLIGTYGVAYAALTVGFLTTRTYRRAQTAS